MLHFANKIIRNATFSRKYAKTYLFIYTNIYTKQNLRSCIIKSNNLVYMCMFHIIDGPSAEGSDQPHFWHDSTQEKTHHLL